MAPADTIVKVPTLRSVEAFQAHCGELGIELPVDATIDTSANAPLARPLTVAGRTIGNRFAILPMEGWDGTEDGRPSDLVLRRWRRFGQSGAKLIWGCEAAAVRRDGRANPRQLVIDESTVEALGDALRELVKAHEQAHGDSSDLLVGLQLTHSGRFAAPRGKRAPRIVYRHPLLDERVGVEDDTCILDDAELDQLVNAFIDAAVLARDAGFGFVDIKHCHGYLAHELLSAVDRPGPYGGSLEARTHFLRQIVEGVRARAPELMLGVRLSAFDFMPFVSDDGGRGAPAQAGDYRYGFGSDATGLEIDLEEPRALLAQLEALDVRLVCITAGSPYYNPHIQRPALYPPSDGYRPPEDPLVGVARQIAVTAQLKRDFPRLTLVGSGYSYLQEWLPRVAQRVVRDGGADLVGLGRMVLSYPNLPADVLAGRDLDTRSICRTFSDCTSAPRAGMVSGCYPLDAFYKGRAERSQLVALKRNRKSAARTAEASGAGN